MLGAVGAGPLLLYGLSATNDTIIGDLGINEAQFGLLVTVCFGCADIGNAILGRVADRHSDISLMTLVFALAAAALVLLSVPAGYWMLLITAGLSGVAQSFPSGVTGRLLLERVPASRRISWVGIKQSGVQVTQLVACLAFPLLAIAVGWRGAALLIALIPLVFMAMTSHFLRPIPLFAVRELDVSLVLGGVTAAAAGAIGVAARVSWARLMARGASGPRLLLVLALIALGAAAMFLGAWSTGWPALLWAAVVMHGVSALGVCVVLMSALMRLIPSTSIASASGVVTAGMFAGFSLGPVGMGILISSPGGFPLGWVAVGLLNLLCLVLAAVLVRAVSKPR